ncbi:MAG: DUF883 C-terminal domain-containing protein [Methylococcales bacterium]
MSTNTVNDSGLNDGGRMESIENIANSAHAAVDMIADVSNHAATALGDKSTQLQNAEQELLSSCRDYVHENPIASLGIAAAAGFVLSRLLSCR